MIADNSRATTTKRVTLTAVERVILRHLVIDHGATYYGRVGGMTFGRADAVRYTTEGWVCKALPDVDVGVLWAAVDVELTDAVLVAGRLTDERVAANGATRWGLAQVHDRAASDAFRAGRFAEALAEIDAGELVCPQRPGLHTWDQLRAFVAKRDVHPGDGS